MLRHYYFRLSSIITPYSIWIVALLHLVGVIGLLSPFSELFRLLTPFNLVLCALILWINHREKHREVLWYSAIIFCSGFLVELIGVHYGIIFGQYSYGTTLGVKLWNVPVIIGLNWLLVMYCIACLTDSLKVATAYKIIMGAVLAVSVDWLIEPVAMHFDFWTWKDGAVPIQNYMGWFFTSIVMQSLYHLLKVRAENKLALAYYFTQLFFFLILNIAIR
jgi:bisanhydrobacterioruberin hydratase